MKKISSTLSILAFSLSSFVSAGEWSGEFEIKDINAGYKDGYIILTSKSAIHNPDNCTGGAYAIHPEYANASHSLSMLLSAEARNKKIRVAVTGCASLANNYPKVTRIRITN